MKRKDLGIAVLGAAAGMAGCSQPMRSLFVPEAKAQGALTPDVTPIYWIRMRHLQVHSNFDVRLQPAEASYWSAASSHPHIAEIDHSFLEHGYLSVHCAAVGDAQIHLAGKNGETMAVAVNVI